MEKNAENRAEKGIFMFTGAVSCTRLHCPMKVAEFSLEMAGLDCLQAAPEFRISESDLTIYTHLWARCTTHSTLLCFSCRVPMALAAF